jgi:hypothetical protein
MIQVLIKFLSDNLLNNGNNKIIVKIVNSPYHPESEACCTLTDDSTLSDEAIENISYSLCWVSYIATDVHID